jgi:predicted TPR repeat methyltransferase/thioredoxin-like negative regulator of GroEL
MKKNNLDLAAVRELHHSGQLDLAETGYLAILRKNPREVEALHSLGILYAQQENMAEALQYLQTAMRYQPHDPVLQLHTANVLKIQGLFDQAANILQKTIQANPGFIAALNNLGTIYYAQGKFDAAIQLFLDVIQKEPNHIDALYNLGLTYNKKEQWTDAIHTYQALLAKSPEHFAARFHLGCVLMREDKMAQALHEFLTIEKSQPYHLETQSNIATCYLKQGALNEAKDHYLKALALAPEDTQILFNLGVINMQLGHVDNAIQHYQKALQTNADLFAAHNNLGVAFLAKQHVPFALHHFKEAARIQPDNKAIDYTIKMLAQNQRLFAAPPDYVKSLFDAYADHYEAHLLSALDYNVPALLYQTITTFSNPLASSLDILDLGCGTGLCGVPFKPFAKSLTGVDLSEKMLEIAAQKQIYDSLICAELDAFLAEKRAVYDLIIAGDVLVYIGELQSLFQHIKQALRPGGLFAFNAEMSKDTDYKMNQSGRFSHEKSYLDNLARQQTFHIVHYSMVKTRMQNNEPVYGHLYILQI